MRDFLLNTRELLDRGALAFLREEGETHGLFPVHEMFFDDRIKLACFTDGKRPIGEAVPAYSLDETCAVAKSILRRIRDLEGCREISLENVVWDRDSIYLDDQGQVWLICLPAVVPEETKNSLIYAKRVYALLQDMVSRKEDGDIVARQILHQQENDFENWAALENALDRRAPKEDESLILKSINTPEVLTFRIRHEIFRIGSDPTEADGLIMGTETISPLHAEIGWNDISFYVRDLESENGTFVNNQQIAPGMEVPIGEGTVLRFAEYTFNVE